MSVKVVFHSDVPPKRVVGTIENVKTATVGSIKALAAKLLALDLGQYTFSVVSYGTNVIEWRQSKETDFPSGLCDGCVVFCLGPAHMKPSRRRLARKIKKEAEEKKKDDDDPAGVYKGLSVKTILKDLSESKDGADSSKRKRMLEYVEMYCDELVKQPKWLELPQGVMIEILKRDGLNIPEVDLFDSICEWAKRQAKSNEVEALKPILEPLVPHIRFPTMQLQDLAVKVERMKLLDQNQLLSLFTFVGAKGNAKLDPALKFNAKPRKPRLPVGAFVWDESKKGASINIVKDSNGKTVRQTAGTNQWNTIITKQWISKGTHVIKFRIDNDSRSHWIFIGVASKAYSRFSDVSNGYIGSQSDSWGWSNGSGSSYLYPGSRTYGRAFNQGDIVEMTVNMTDKTISYRLNDGQSFGEAFRGISDEVAVAVTLYDESDQVTIL
jgi:hypothetical protein